MFKNLREPVSGLTHLFGVFASIVGLIVLVQLSVAQGTLWHVVTFSVFGASLILLYTASSVYHMVSISDKVVRILRRVDHSMIYVLIAGSYTPICLVALRGAWGWSIFGTIWGLAIAGILIKNFWFNAPRWISTLFYILMGWLVVIAIYPLAHVLPRGGMYWLFAGGIFYTVGGVIYATKWPKIEFKNFGFHEIFHIFVLLGSFCHYWLMLRYILYV